MIVAFDIDDTLWKVRYRGCPNGCRLSHRDGQVAGHYDQVPDFDLIQVLRWFHQNGDKVLVWSAGGVQYAEAIVAKLGLDDMVTVVEKAATNSADLTFDDQEVKLGTVNVRVSR